MSRLKALTAVLVLVLLAVPALGQLVRLNTVPYDADKKEVERLLEADRQYERRLMEAPEWSENAWVYFTLKRPEQEIEVSGGKTPVVVIKAAGGELEGNPARISADDEKLKLSFKIQQDGRKKARKIKVRCDLPEEGSYEMGVFLMPASQEFRCISRKLDESGPA